MQKTPIKMSQNIANRYPAKPRCEQQL